MPGQNKHIYTSEDIQRYHSGAMSQAEMHAMEKAALEDPFLADAMEGYVHSSDMTAELASLRSRLGEKTTTKVVAMPVRNRNFGWMRIAALFLVLAVGGWLIFRTQAPDLKETAMQKPVSNETAGIKNTDVAAGSAGAADTATEETYVPVIKDQPVVAAAPATIKSRQIHNGNISRSLPPVDDANEFRDSTSIVPSAEMASTGTVVPQKAAAKESYGYLNTKPGTNTFNGVVTDESNNAIPFASIIARNSNGTLSDNNGRFQLSVPDTVSVVGVNAPGYLSRNVDLRNTKDQIVLQESKEAYEEVVLQRNRSEYEAKRRQPVKQTIVEIGELEPEGGWSEYNSYLAEKLTPPKSKKKTVPTGVVELSFDVDEKGNPVNITVEKSLCEACDREAIRLLKDGPKWKRQEGKGKITIRF